MQFIGLGRFFHGLGVNAKWGGVSAVLSGNTSVVVSATNVLSGYPILITAMGSGGHTQTLTVDSIVDNTSFAVRTNSGAAIIRRDFSWVCFRN